MLEKLFSRDRKYFVVLKCVSKDDKRGKASQVVTTNGKMNIQAIRDIEKLTQEEKDLKSCLIINYIEL